MTFTPKSKEPKARKRTVRPGLTNVGAWIPDEKAQKITSMARKAGLTREDLVRQMLDHRLSGVGRT